MGVLPRSPARRVRRHRGSLSHGRRRRPADHSPERPGDRPREEGRDVRLQPRVDVRLATSCGRSRSRSTRRSWRRRGTSIVGPMVTNPLTRDWTVTASLFATLNEMFGNRTVIGIGRGDSAVRVINGKPSTLAVAPRGDPRHQGAGERARGRVPRLHAPVPLGAEEPGRGLGRRLRSEGAAGDRRGRRRIHPAARRPGHHGMDDRSGAEGRRRCRARSRGSHDLRGRPRVRDRRRRPRAAISAGGSVGWSATTSPTSSPATARTRRSRRRSPTTSRDARATTTTSTARRATSTPQFVPDEIVDRFCVLGPVEEHIRRLQELKAMGVRPVRGLPPARRQGRDPAGVRREGHPGHRRHGAGEVVTDRVRRTWMFALSSGARRRALGALQVDRAAGRRKLFGLTVLPRANDTAMPHVWEMLSRYARPERRGATGSIALVVLSGAWFTFRLAFTGFVIGASVGIGARRADGEVQGDRTRAAAVPRGLADDPADRARSARRQLGREAAHRRVRVAAVALRLACSARSWRSSRWRSARCEDSRRRHSQPRWS